MRDYPTELCQAPLALEPKTASTSIFHPGAAGSASAICPRV
jgi:hypothetical protein